MHGIDPALIAAYAGMFVVMVLFIWCFSEPTV